MTNNKHGFLDLLHLARHRGHQWCRYADAANAAETTAGAFEIIRVAMRIEEALHGLPEGECPDLNYEDALSAWRVDERGTTVTVRDLGDGRIIFRKTGHGETARVSALCADHLTPSLMAKAVDSAYALDVGSLFLAAILPSKGATDALLEVL